MNVGIAAATIPAPPPRHHDAPAREVILEVASRLDELREHCAASACRMAAASSLADVARVAREIWTSYGPVHRVAYHRGHLALALEIASMTALAREAEAAAADEQPDVDELLAGLGAEEATS